MPKIKILHLTTDSKVGGTEKNILALVSNLDKDRYENMVVALMSGGDLIEKVREQGLKGEILGINSILDLCKLLRLWRLMRSEKIDILHTYLWHANIAGRIIGCLARVPVIISSERCLDLNRSMLKVRLNRLTAPLCRKISCVSDQVKQILIKREKIQADKIAVIYSGVICDEKEFKDNTIEDRNNFREKIGIEPETKLVGSVGRLRPEKGHRYFIEAAAKLFKKRRGEDRVNKAEYNMRFLIAGDGPEEDRLRSLAVELGIDEHIIFCGYCDNVPEVLLALDVFVQPSLEEGLPLAVIEAMAAGVPVVATAVGGTKELVVHEQTGRLAKPADSQSLFLEIEELLKDDNVNGEMVVNARAMVRDRFSLRRMVEQTEQLYAELSGPN